MIAKDYLPYLEANSRAVAAGEENVSYRAQGVASEIPTAPYRAECLNTLKHRFASLNGDAAPELAELLPNACIEIHKGPITSVRSGTDRRGRVRQMIGAAEIVRPRPLRIRDLP